MEERFALHMREVQTGIKASIDGLARTFGELRNGLREERDMRHGELQQAEAKLEAKLEEIQALLPTLAPPSSFWAQPFRRAPGVRY